MKSISILWAALPSIYAQSLQMVDVSMQAECDGALHTVVYEFPAFFSTVYESASTIFNFMGGTNSLVIDNPPQTIITSTILTTTIVSTVTTTATTTVNPMPSPTLGAGIPSGTVTSIPSSAPVALGYLNDALLASAPASGFSTGNGTSSDPRDAQFWYIQDGQLRSIDGGVVGRNFSDNYAALVPSTDINDVTTNFTMVNGVLQWNSPEKGLATFYNCAGNLYAGFPNAPFGNCTGVTIGGISKYVVDAILALSPMSSTGSQKGTSTPSMSSSTTSGTAMSNSMNGGTLSTSSSSQKSSGASSSTSSTTSASSTSKSVSSSSTSSMSVSSSTSATSAGSSAMSTSSRSTTTSASTTSSFTTSSASPSSVVSIITCPADDNDVVQGYNIYCGKGVDGLNLGEGILLADFQTCVTLCTDTTGCVSVSFNTVNGYCYLHSTRHTTFTDVGGTYDSAELVDNSSTSTTSDDGSSGQTTSSSTTSNSASTSASTTTPTMTTTASTTSTSSAASGGSSICPGTAAGAVVMGYEIYCDQVVDPVLGSDTVLPPPTDIATLADCLALCDDTDGCVGLSYYQPGTTCYVHKGQNQEPKAPPGDGWSGAIMVGYEPGSGTTITVTSSTTTTTTTTTSISSSTESTSTTTTTASTSSSTTSESTTTTSTSPSTTSASTTITTSAAGGGGGTSSTTSASTSSTTAAGGSYDDPSCSTPDDKISPDGTPYKVFCGKALTSTDTYPTTYFVDSLSACVQACDQLQTSEGIKCISVSFHYQGGGVQPCYLHTGSDLMFNGDIGYHSAILDDDTNASDPCLNGAC